LNLEDLKKHLSGTTCLKEREVRQARMTDVQGMPKASAVAAAYGRTAYGQSSVTAEQMDADPETPVNAAN